MRDPKDGVVTRFMDFNDGIRVRHWVDKNSVKVYNEQNVLRIETTINDSVMSSEKCDRLPVFSLYPMIR